MLTQEAALKALAERRQNKPKQIDNGRLRAGSPMYFYCRSCGHQSDCLDELYQPGPNTPKKLCAECQFMQDKGWLPKASQLARTLE